MALRPYANLFAFSHREPAALAAVAAARSCAGLVPFYLRASADYAAVATRQGDVARYLPEEVDFDPLVTAIWTEAHFIFADGRSCLEGVRVLDRGHFARLAPGRPI